MLVQEQPAPPFFLLTAREEGTPRTLAGVPTEMFRLFMLTNDFPPSRHPGV